MNDPPDGRIVCRPGWFSVAAALAELALVNQVDQLTHQVDDVTTDHQLMTTPYRMMRLVSDARFAQQVNLVKARYAHFWVNQCQNVSWVKCLGFEKSKVLNDKSRRNFLQKAKHTCVRLARKGKKDRQHFSFVLRPVQCVWRRASRVVEGKTNLTLRVIDWQEKKPDTNQWSTSVRSKEANVQNWTLELSVFPTFFSFGPCQPLLLTSGFSRFLHSRWKSAYLSHLNFGGTNEQTCL